MQLTCYSLLLVARLMFTGICFGDDVRPIIVVFFFLPMNECSAYTLGAMPHFCRAGIHIG